MCSINACESCTSRSCTRLEGDVKSRRLHGGHRGNETKEKKNRVKSESKMSRTEEEEAFVAERRMKIARWSTDRSVGRPVIENQRSRLNENKKRRGTVSRRFRSARGSAGNFAGEQEISERGLFFFFFIDQIPSPRSSTNELTMKSISLNVRSFVRIFSRQKYASLGAEFLSLCLLFHFSF